MPAILGIVKLAKGRVGYFDELTRIHLTLSSPERPVLAGMNTTNLKRAIKTGSIELVSGSLDPEALTPVKPEVVKVAAVSVPEMPVVQEAATEEAKVDDQEIAPNDDVSEPDEKHDEEPAAPKAVKAKGQGKKSSKKQR